MWEKTVNLFKAGAAMLQTGKFPPNTPKQYQEELGEINFLKSKKFFMVFFASILLVAFGSLGVFGLFLTAAVPVITVPYVTLVCKIFDMLAIIIGIWLGAQTTLDFKFNSNSNVNLEGRNENITVTEEKRIIREGDGNAPEIKPFGVIAVDE